MGLESSLNVEVWIIRWGGTASLKDSPGVDASFEMV
jgi:hypothetical protein